MNIKSSGNVAENLKFLMGRDGFNPTSLARAISEASAAKGAPRTNQATIFRIISGQTKCPNEKAIQPIAEFFGISTHQLRYDHLITQSFPPGRVTQESLGGLLLRARKNSNFTQKDLAAIIGVAQQSITKWESGKTLPSKGMLKKLGDALSISISELLGACARSKYGTTSAQTDNTNFDSNRSDAPEQFELRDFFASMAMLAHIIRSAAQDDSDLPNEREFAEGAYAQADSMLEVRKSESPSSPLSLRFSSVRKRKYG